MPSSSSHRRSAPQPFGYGRDWIRSAKETNSPTASSVTSVDLRREHQQAEEELELSTVRSSRAASRTKRTSEEIFFTTDETSKRRSRHEVLLLLFFIFHKSNLLFFYHLEFDGNVWS